MNLLPATQALVDRIMNGHEPLLRLLERDRIPIREAIVLALKEQDRNTRHACAEAVQTMPNPFGFTITADRLGRQGFDAAKTQAHAACMNAHAV